MVTSIVDSGNHGHYVEWPWGNDLGLLLLTEINIFQGIDMWLYHYIHSFLWNVAVHFIWISCFMLCYKQYVALTISRGIFSPKTSHYSDVTMGVIASLVTSLTIVYSTVYSGADQRKHQSSASLAFVRGIHRWAENYPHEWPVTRNLFPFDDVIKNTFHNSRAMERPLWVNGLKSFSILPSALSSKPCHICPWYIESLGYHITLVRAVARLFVEQMALNRHCKHTLMCQNWGLIYPILPMWFRFWSDFGTLWHVCRGTPTAIPTCKKDISFQPKTKWELHVITLSPAATKAAIIASKLRNYSGYLLEWHESESQLSSHFAACNFAISYRE